MNGRTYEVWYSPLNGGGIRVNARRMLRYYDEDNGHYWAEKTVKMAFDHEGENPEKVIRKAWPEASEINWVGDTERGTLWFASED